MSEQPVQPVAPAQPGPGPLGRLVERIEGKAGPEIQHLEGDVAHVTADVAGFLTDHASTVYGFAGDFLDAIKLIDPADAAALAAFQALVPRAIALAGKVSDLAQAALKGA
ncbi:MAG: hypothetical protein ACRDP5_06725 [Streptosporangiaceae bacterium]